ncbi:hypothetical protein SLS62_000852 [Diatrype stigma]|uniref:Uncharacterized protein n=1 Tax=Diatrype stigma TaxID=117547 RepID=A0AAN9V1G6_9PEZI
MTVLIDQLDHSEFEALQIALESHRYALHLNKHDADTLFNTSQLLSSLAECMPQDDDNSPQSALDLLEEAVKLQNECLAIQDAQYTETLAMMKHQAQQETTQGDAGEVNHPGKNELENAQPDSEERWVTIVDPVTLDTLLDTALAQLAVLTTICEVLLAQPHYTRTLSSVDKDWNPLEEKLAVLSTNLPGRAQEVALARANFISAFLEAGYVHRQINGEAYKKGRDTAFAVGSLQLESSVLALHANAQSLLSFNSSVAAVAPEDKQLSTMRWNALTASIANMTAASKLQGINQEEVEWIKDYRDEIHHVCGDASMALYTMGHPPTSYPTAIAQSTQLLKNAQVYYLNAAKLAPPSRRAEMEFRSLVADGLRGGADALQVGAGEKVIEGIVIASSKGKKWATDQYREMAAEGGLIPASLQHY